MTPALIDRLSLTAARIEGMAEGVRQTAGPPRSGRGGGGGIPPSKRPADPP